MEGLLLNKRRPSAFYDRRIEKWPDRNGKELVPEVFLTKKSTGNTKWYKKCYANSVGSL